MQYHLSLEEQNWLEEVAQKLHLKMTYAVTRARQVPDIPYTTQNGTWAPNSIDWRTNGFWPASMWQMYLAQGETMYREEAIRTVMPEPCGRRSIWPAASIPTVSFVPGTEREQRDEPLLTA